MVAKFTGPQDQGFFAPQRFAADIADCEVSGTVPSDMHGDFVRVGGEWFYPPKFADDAPLHTDGYISRFRFRNGRVSYRGRFVETPRFKANLAAGRQQFGYYRNRFTDDPAVQGIDGTVSNTAPMVHAGKLFTLKEDALPYRIDPDTLETLGPWDFGGKWKSQTFTAHPKVDPVSGEMIAFGYEATGPATNAVFLYHLNKVGEVTREVRLTMPYVSMIHDFAVTQKHVIFPFACYTTSLERLQAGKIHWTWDRTLPSMIGIIPRDGEPRDMRWFKGPERCMMHTFNARSEGNKVVLDAPFWNGNFFPFFPNIDGSQWDPAKAVSFVRRYTFDLGSRSDAWTEETLFPMPITDLGKIDHRFMTLPHRYAFAPWADKSKPFDEARAGNLQGRVTNSYARFDLATGTMQSLFAGNTHSLQECTFVPRRGSTAEGDGYLIGTASNLAEMRTELVIADAQRLGEGEIARVYLPFRAATQVHGYWYEAEQLEGVA